VTSTIGIGGAIRMKIAAIDVIGSIERDRAIDIATRVVLRVCIVPFCELTIVRSWPGRKK
jgi:hypothetical protein